MRKTLTLQQKRSFAGVLFVLPWLVGFLLLFLSPLIESIKFSFSKLTIQTLGYSLKFAGFSNFNNALRVDPTFNRTLTTSVEQMLLSVPIILFFSLFIATILNQRFRGRTIARAIFFLPVILASGAITAAESSSMIQQIMAQATQNGGDMVNFNILKGLQLEALLIHSGVSRPIVDFLVGSVNQIYDIISHSGVQILIFLAGLQSISGTMYEVAKMEGATGYEMFWKITFPMVSPLILTNIIYSIIDSFSNNSLTTEIYAAAFKSLDFGLSSAMAWIYTLVIVIILGIIGYFVSKKVFYNE